jgi:GNAT superfamily N-acetyltransferase
MAPTLSALSRAQERSAAQLLCEAFVEDPFWMEVSPGSPRRRRRVVTLQAELELAVSRRGGRPAIAAWDGEELLGLALWHPRPPGRRPRFPALANPPLWLAGPLALHRALRIDRIVDRHTPRHPHLYVSELAVASAARGRGVGSTLLERALAEARTYGLPVHLETFREVNLDFYARFDFVVSAEIALARGHTLWVLDRPDRPVPRSGEPLDGDAGRPPRDGRSPGPEWDPQTSTERRG